MADLQQISKNYATAAVAQVAAIASADPDTANREYEALLGAYRALAAGGPQGIALLRHLADDDDERVRQWAAAHLLWHDPSAAQRVLEELAASKGVIALNARMTLQQWRNGALERP